MKSIIKILAVFFVSLFAGAFIFCAEDETIPPPTNPIFTDVETIQLVSPPHDDSFSTTRNAGTVSFQFDLPENVNYVVLALFDAEISIIDNIIVNPLDWVAGSRSSLPNFSRSNTSAVSLFPFNPGLGDFTTVSTYDAGVSGVVPHFWAVWGYDSNYNLIAASPRWKVEINWP